MDDAASLAAKEALAQALALRMFPVVEVGLFFICVLLARSSLPKGRLSPLRFGFLFAGVVALGGAFTALWGVEFLPFALELALGLLLSLQSPVVAIAFLLAMTFLRPWEATGMAQMSFIPKTLGLIAIGSWIFHGARSRKFSVLFNWPSRLFMMFSLWVFCSAVVFGDLAAGLSAFANTMLVASVLFVLVANVPNRPEDLRLLERALVLSIAVVLAHASLMTLFHGGSEGLRLEGIGLTGNANDLAALAALALPFAVIPALTEKTRADRRIAYATVPVFLFGLWLAESRGALLAVGASAVSYVILRARRPGKAIFISALFIPLIVGAVFLLSQLRSSQDIQGSTESRLGYLTAGLRMAAHNPVLGVGFSNYPKLYEAYSSGDFTYEWGERTAHSSWILALAETGLPGFLLLAALFLSTFRRSWRLRAARPELLLAMIGYGIAMSFLSHTYTFFPYLLFAIVLAAAKLIKTPVKNTEVEGADVKSMVAIDPHPVSWGNARMGSKQ